ncbi:hypothetical protein Zmor_002206 [Zophobas morio]|uniref:Uncharacterized protein n=1 Tax=Zophobas morio TaxID=2755281 RepID=A0AA38J420_9CUCU|nr:hypothetical protein Zmor_002206 [Zophobas morio]
MAAATKLPGPSILHPVIYNVATPPDKYCLPAGNVTHACNRAFTNYPNFACRPAVFGRKMGLQQSASKTNNASRRRQ